MDNQLILAYESLAAWCRERNYAGYDPFDALNSRIFRSTPLSRSRAARLAWTQLHKRSPINLRRISAIPPDKNPKGIALFALASLAEFRRTRGKQAETDARARLDELMTLSLKTPNGTAWGYNFDWQGRAFLARKGTPTIVPTAFAVRAFTEAARDLEDESYLSVACGAAEFILNDLPRTVETEEQICWSYSPVDRTRIFNASLLAAEALASVSALSGGGDFCDWAVRAARYVLGQQQEDGSWAYGADGYQSWTDSFHTAFVLVSLARIARYCPDSGNEFLDSLKKGYAFWRESFFLSDGWPKYFHDRLYPADAHSAGAAIVALVELKELDDTGAAFAEQVALWTIQNLRDPSGFFYYQRRHFHTVRTPYMRWSQAWMLYGLARLLEGKS